jgi:protein-tyrosine phosphatase
MLRQVELSQFPETSGFGRLFLPAMPGREMSVEAFIGEVNQQDVKLIVCLVGDEELRKKSPKYLEAAQSGMLLTEVLHLPIPDYGLPPVRNAFILTLRKVLSRWASGESCVIHCAAGCGRTGMTAIMLLQLAGIDSVEAYAIVREAGSFPDTKAQENYANHEN